MRALIFAAGLGTRLKPLTDTLPKALVPVGGQPLLYHVLRKLRAAGICEVTVNVHHFADRIISYLASRPVPGMSVTVSDERDFLRETGGGIRHAEPLLVPAVSGSRPGFFWVHNVDILSNLDLGRFAARVPSYALAALAVSDRKTQRYFLFREEPSSADRLPAAAPEDCASGPSGRGEPECPDRMLRLVGWTNVATGEVRTPFPDLDVSACRKLAFSGIHLISDRIFDVFRAVDAACLSGCPVGGGTAPAELLAGGKGPAKVAAGAVDRGGNGLTESHPAPLGERFSITDFYLRVCADYPIYGIVPPDFRMIDVGKPETLAAAEDFLSFQL